MTLNTPEEIQKATLSDLQKERGEIAARAKPLAMRQKDGDALSEGEVGQLTEYADALQMLGAEIMVRERMAETSQVVFDADDQSTKSRGRIAGQAPRGEHTEQPVFDMRGIGQRFVESEQYERALKTRTGSMKDDPFRTASLHPSEKRALIYSGTPSASTLLADVFPSIGAGREPFSAIRTVLGSAQTNSDNVTVIREDVFTNAAVEVGEATTVSGGAKPESALTFTEETFPVRTIAHWIPITRQAMEDTPFLASYVEQRLLDGLERRVSLQLIAGNGTAPNISGILDQSGLTLADAAYFAANAVNDAGTDNENPNRIRRAKRLVSTAGLGTASFILANPADTEDWETLSDTAGSYLFGGPASGSTIGRMWGLPVYEDEYVTAGTALVGDGTMAAVVDRMDAAIYTADQHSDFFIRNIFVLLAEVRLALAVYRPAAFVSVTLA